MSVVIYRPHRRRRTVAVALVLAVAAAAALAGAPSVAAQTSPAPTTTTPAAPPAPPDPQLLAAAIELVAHQHPPRPGRRPRWPPTRPSSPRCRPPTPTIDQQQAATKVQIDQLQAELAGRAAQVYEQQANVTARCCRSSTPSRSRSVSSTPNAASVDDTRQLAQLNAAEAQLDQERGPGRRARVRASPPTSRTSRRPRPASRPPRPATSRSSPRPAASRSWGRLGSPARRSRAGSARPARSRTSPTTPRSTARRRCTSSEGDAEGVAGDVAFAQAVLETGSFGHALDNNYSGIGACDSCTSEIAFPTPLDGVRAQIQLLKSYADPSSTRGGARQTRPSRRCSAPAARRRRRRTTRSRTRARRRRGT